MYLEFFGLKEAPFAITPDPRFVFLSERHRDALAHLLYGIGQGGGGGFVQLTGEVGTGKTTLSRLLLEQLPPNTRVALVLNPRLSPLELVETICEELHLDVVSARGSLKSLVDVLNAHLLEAHARGERVVVILDEAQDLSTEALEQVRLLTNLETPTQKLLQILLLGQPELRDKLDQADLRQLAQRVTARYHLTPLDAAETEAYLRHRLAVAGAQRFPFSKLAVRTIYLRSGGVPRVINAIAERALLAGYVSESNPISARWVDRAADEALGRHARRRRWLAAAALLVVAAGATWFWRARDTAPAAATVAKPAPAAPAEPAAPAVDLAEKLGALPDAAGAAVWNRALEAWGVASAGAAAVAEAERCPLHLSVGLSCVRGNANLGRIAALGRPVVLLLHARGRTRPALLVALDGERAAIDVGERVVKLPRAELERSWFGEYVALWRAPAGLPDAMRRGDSGASVEWLRRALGAGIATTGAFDAGVESQVRALQGDFGLAADGIVGPETQMLLAARLPDGPRLAMKVD